ncbi:MAG: NADH:flavin oxidoreductase [Desulfuromonadaceae bacterium]|nr:NADH:flavin oxidoreductase [Desulfuromonadaceae bacterium]
MRTLFDTTQINTMTLANRFVFSATWLGLADEEGCSTTKQAEYLAELARRGVGLIITGHAYVMPEGKAGLRQTAACDDRFLPGLTETADAVHDAGGKILLQLSHAGCYAAARLTGLAAVGPSANDSKDFPDCSELTLDGITQIVAAFGQCAERAKEAGFDGVQIHGAHGYLLSQFLSPYFNKRTDSYGGSIENRARIVIETLHAVRKAVGAEFPVLIKLNSEDFLQGGFTVEEMLQVVSLLEQEGIDAIEMSGGTIASGALVPIRTAVPEREKEVYYREAAILFKEKIGVPLLLVGGIRSFEVCKELVEKGWADYLSLSRPLICEPNLVERWKSGDTAKSSCISCSGCLKAGFRGRGVRCVLTPSSG